MKPGGMLYIRNRYNVPAKRGGLIRVNGGDVCRILSASAGKLHVLNCDKETKEWYHPADCITYLIHDCLECNGTGYIYYFESGYDSCYFCEGYGKVYYPPMKTVAEVAAMYD